MIAFTGFADTTRPRRRAGGNDSADLIGTCERHWSRLAPLHRWLVDRVQAAEPSPSG